MKLFWYNLCREIILFRLWWIRNDIEELNGNIAVLLARQQFAGREIMRRAELRATEFRLSEKVKNLGTKIQRLESEARYS